jgi:ketosteroid isomerase-like protein
MSDEASNIATLKEAYRMWRETKGGSVDHWMGICDENIQFGSIAQGQPRVAYMTEYKARDELAQYFEGLKRDWEMIEFKTDHFVAQGDRVIMLGSCS